MAVVFFAVVAFAVVRFAAGFFAAVVFFAGGFVAVVFFAGGFAAADGSVVAAFFAGARSPPRASVPASARRAGRPSHSGGCPSVYGDRLLRLVRVLGALTTCSFFTIARPSRFFGSMPRTAFSTTNCGRSRMSRS